MAVPSTAPLTSTRIPISDRLTKTMVADKPYF